MPPMQSDGDTGLGFGALWAIVLAGGEGTRLRPLTRHICGDNRPKQYAALAGSDSLLRETLKRVALLVPPERTVVVTHRRHARWVAAEFVGENSPRVLAQPEDRGTAAGVLYPTHWVHRHDPMARVAIFPADHFISDPALFMRYVCAVADFVTRRPDRLVLLGARPSSAEVEYGWIEPAARLDCVGGEPIYDVGQFVEKPSAPEARRCLSAGCLWNTFVMVGTAATVLNEGHRALPELAARLSLLDYCVGTEDEPWALAQAYALAPTANFSRAVLQRCPPCLAVGRLPRLSWSDWGTPERVVGSLRRAGISPPWLAALEASGR